MKKQQAEERGDEIEKDKDGKQGAKEAVDTNKDEVDKKTQSDVSIAPVVSQPCDHEKSPSKKQRLLPTNTTTPLASSETENNSCGTSSTCTPPLTVTPVLPAPPLVQPGRSCHQDVGMIRHIKDMFLEQAKLWTTFADTLEQTACASAPMHAIAHHHQQQLTAGTNQVGLNHNIANQHQQQQQWRLMSRSQGRTNNENLPVSIHDLRQIQARNSMPRPPSHTRKRPPPTKARQDVAFDQVTPAMLLARQATLITPENATKRRSCTTKRARATTTTTPPVNSRRRSRSKSTTMRGNDPVAAESRPFATATTESVMPRGLKQEARSVATMGRMVLFNPTGVQMNLEQTQQEQQKEDVQEINNTFNSMTASPIRLPLCSPPNQGGIDPHAQKNKSCNAAPESSSPLLPNQPNNDVDDIELFAV